MQAQAQAGSGHRGVHARQQTARAITIHEKSAQQHEALKEEGGHAVDGRGRS